MNLARQLILQPELCYYQMSSHAVSKQCNLYKRLKAGVNHVLN
jgi:hypothetical protein